MKVLAGLHLPEGSNTDSFPCLFQLRMFQAFLGLWLPCSKVCLGLYVAFSSPVSVFSVLSLTRTPVTGCRTQPGKSRMLSPQRPAQTLFLSNKVPFTVSRKEEVHKSFRAPIQSITPRQAALLWRVASSPLGCTLARTDFPQVSRKCLLN